ENDQSAPLDVEARRVLTPVIVKYELALALVRGEVGRIATGPVAHADLHLRVRDHLLERRADDGTRGEAMPRDDSRLVRHHDAHRGGGEITAVENAEALWLSDGRDRPSVTERVLSTHVKRKLAAHLSSVLLEKGDEPAEVIEVPMTHDEGIDGRRIDLQ